MRNLWCPVAAVVAVSAALILCAGCGGSGKVSPARMSELQKKLKDADPAVRADAIESIRVLGSKAKDSIPDLLALLEDEDRRCRVWAAEALGQMGEDAYPHLLKGVKHDKAEIRALSWISIAGLTSEVKGNHVDELVKLLPEGLKDEAVEVRQKAATTFHRMNAQAAKAVPDMIEALKANTDKYVICDLIGGLAKCEGDRSAAMPTLQKLAKHTDNEIQAMANGLIMVIEGKTEPDAVEQKKPTDDEKSRKTSKGFGKK